MTASPGFYPTLPQWQILMDPHRFKVVVAGRRFGKTYLSLMWLIMHASGTPDERRGWKTCWYVAPTYRQAKEIAWKLLKRLIPREIVARVNENELQITCRNGNEISLRGADNYDSLRGVALSALVLDEFASMHQSAWTEVLRPALADLQGSLLAIGSPAGYNHFYDMYNHAHDHAKYPQWESFKFTTEDGGNVPVEEIESAKREMDPRTFRQEFLASFESLDGRVYQEFARSRNIREDVLHAPGRSVLVGLDFNVNPMSAVVAHRYADQLHVFGEISIPNGNTELMCEALKERFRGESILVFPDPSGNSRKTSAPVGITDFAILQQSGLTVMAPPKAPPVKDRINNVNAMIKDAAGASRLFVSPSCTKLIKALEGLTYIPETSVPDKSGGLDHIVDALGYLVNYEFPIVTRRVSSSELLM